MNISKVSGLNFEIGQNKLIYKKEDYAPSVDWDKPFEAGKYAYKNPTSGPEVLYFGARYTENTADEEVFVKNNFMVDVTVLNPGKVGDEFVKTVGHYHQNVPGFDLAYPEVYEVLTGKIEYLLQTKPNQNGEVDVLWVITEPGDKVVMMPGCGHVGTNVGSELAVEVDLQVRDNPNFSDYSVFKDYNGGSLYRTDKGLEENPKYKIRSLRIVTPRQKPEWGITKDKPLYTSFVESPEKFAWLTKPQDYKFEIDDLFEDAEL